MKCSENSFLLGRLLAILLGTRFARAFGSILFLPEKKEFLSVGWLFTVLGRTAAFLLTLFAFLTLGSLAIFLLALRLLTLGIGVVATASASLSDLKLLGRFLALRLLTVLLRWVAFAAALSALRTFTAILLGAGEADGLGRESKDRNSKESHVFVLLIIMLI